MDENNVVSNEQGLMDDEVVVNYLITIVVMQQNCKHHNEKPMSIYVENSNTVIVVGWEQESMRNYLIALIMDVINDFVDFLV